MFRCRGIHLCGFQQLLHEIGCAGRPYPAPAPQTRCMTRSHSAAATPAEIFDRHLKALHRDRAVHEASHRGPDQLVSAVAERLVDRLRDISGRTFPRALVIGGAPSSISHLLAVDKGVAHVTYTDISPQQVNAARAWASTSKALVHDGSHVECMVLDDESLPGIEEKTFDIVLSCLSLHWVNDIPGAMRRYREILRPDGLLLSAMWGGNSMQEMRIACAVAEMERRGGVSSRTSPLAQVRDAGGLLTGAGFALPAVDTDDFEVAYSDVLDLVQHLRWMGEGNAAVNRQRALPRDVALAAAAAFHGMTGNDDQPSCTFQVIYQIGWAPDPSQRRPRERGSAEMSLKDLESSLSEAPDGKS